jgi:hypothetical protein
MTLAQIKAKHGATFGEGYTEARRDHTSWMEQVKNNARVQALASHGYQPNKLRTVHSVLRKLRGIK